MRHPNGIRVQIPYVDTEGKRNVTLLSFNGDVDRRRVIREVRKFIKHAFGLTVTKEWLLRIPTYIPLYKTDVCLDKIDQAIEEWIQRIECHEDEDEGHTSRETGTTGEAETPMQAVSSEPQESSVERCLS